MIEFLRKLGFGEKPVERTLEEKLALIRAKATDGYASGGVSSYTAGTDGIDVEEVTEREAELLHAESKKVATIQTLEDPNMNLIGKPVQTPVRAIDPWGRINPKGRRDGGG